MIQDITSTYFSLRRLHTLSKKVDELLESRHPGNLMLAAVLTPLKSKMAIALKAINSSSKSELSTGIRQADKNRDDSYMALKNYVKSGMRRRNDEFRKACEDLWLVFVKNNIQLYSLADEEETSAIDSLVADLSTAENQARMVTINAVDWLNELVADNDAFNGISGLRTESRTVDNTVVDTKAFMELKAAFELVGSMLNSMVALNDPEGIAETAAMVNQHITESTNAGRLSKAGNSNDDEEISQS